MSKLHDNSVGVYKGIELYDDSEIDSRDYGSLAMGLLAAEGSGKTLVISADYEIRTALTIPCSVRVVKGGSFTKLTGGSLAFTGTFEAGLWQVFSGFSAGDVTFGIGAVKEVDPHWFIDDTSDAAAGITAAFSATYYGGRMRFTRMYTVENDLPIIITKSVAVLGPGGATGLLGVHGGGGIFLASSVGAGTDVININPATASTDAVQFHNVNIVPSSGTPGRDAIRINVDSTHLLRELIIDNNCTIHADGAGHAVNGVNTVGDLNPMGIFHSRIENSMLTGGIKFNKLGDSNIIRFNIISGNNIGIDITTNMLADAGGPAAQLTIEENNITSTGGAIKINGAWMVRIAKNNIEQLVQLNGGYMVHIENCGGRLVNSVFQSPDTGTMPGVVEIMLNKISPTDPTSQVNGLLVKDSWAVDIHNNFVGSSWISGTNGTTCIVVQGSMETQIEDNDLFLSSYCTGVNIDAGSKNTRYFGNRKNTYSVNHTEIVDNGVGTMGLWKTGTINALYAAYSPNYNSFGYMKDRAGIVHLIGTIKPATGSTATINDVIFTFADGFIPDYNLPHSATAALAAYSIYPVRVMGKNGGGTPGQLIMDLTVNDMAYFSLDGLSYPAPLADY